MSAELLVGRAPFDAFVFFIGSAYAPGWEWGRLLLVGRADAAADPDVEGSAFRDAVELPNGIVDHLLRDPEPVRRPAAFAMAGRRLRSPSRCRSRPRSRTRSSRRRRRCGRRGAPTRAGVS